MLHTSRMLVSYLSNGDVSDESFVTALLGETESNLATWRERQVCEEPCASAVTRERVETARRALDELMARTRALGAQQPPTIDPAEVRDAAPSSVELEPASSPLLPADPLSLDGAITELAALRARRTVHLSTLAPRFLDGRLWRRLGFTNLSAYVDARPQVCLSTLEHQATLGRHLRRHPLIAQALSAGEIGTEAALPIGWVLGRFGDEGRVPGLAWEIGRRPIILVRGRERSRAE